MKKKLKCVKIMKKINKNKNMEKADYQLKW